MAQTATPDAAPILHEAAKLPDRQQLLSTQWWDLKLNQFVDWLTSSGVHIVVILILLFVGLKITRAFVRRTVMLTVKPGGKDALRDLMVSKRQTTLIRLFDAIAMILFITMAFLMILSEIGIAVGPLIASAGIAGVAIGLGAQSLVKDVLVGAFIIMEQQFSVGDVIKTAGVSGAVEEINLRTTLLRDADGSVHIIPNSQIAQATVLTRDWSRLVLDIGIGYGSDIDQAISILKQVLDAYAAAHADFVIEPPEVLGVQDLADSSVLIRAWMKVVPGKQWAAGRTLRADIKKAFDAAGIEIPFPQRTLWVRSDKAL